MHIGFDAKRYFQNKSGLGNYSRTLVHSLVQLYPDETFTLFSAGDNQLELNSKNVKIVSANKSFKPLWRSFGIAQNIREEKIDIFHGLSNEIPFSLKQLKVKKVVTIHDLIFKHFPDHYPIIDRTIYNFKSKYACVNSDVIIATSESTKKDIVHFYNIKPEHIQVVFQSCDPIFKIILQKEERDKILFQYNLPKEFILYVGSFNKRKNVKAIIEAYSLIPKHLRVPVVCIGQENGHTEMLKKMTRVHQLQDSFIFLHQIESKQLPAFYQSAICFIYPSLFEGFGIPILEAMSSACPIITSNNSSLVELGGDAAVYINPSHIEEIAQAIQKVISSKEIQENIKVKGIIRSELLQLKNPAIEMMQIYKNLF